MNTHLKYLLLLPIFSHISLVYILFSGSEHIILEGLTLVVGIITTLFAILSAMLMLGYEKSPKLVESKPLKKTSVDIYLPICGEDKDVLIRTWDHVKAMREHSRSRKMLVNVFVLEDTKQFNQEIKDLAKSYTFRYIRRPNVGEMKKAGNLKNAFSKTKGEFFVIFDADFAPIKEFLNITIPYIQKDSTIGIIQTPQSFMLEGVNSWEYGASVYQDFFYNVVQKAWEFYDGVICVGSNAVYRREALEKIGGTVQIDHSEDIWTGYLLKTIGYSTKYINQQLAFGRSPDSIIPYFKQQVRWCHGSMSLMMSEVFWKANTKFITKMCYISGFLFYLTSPLFLLLPLLGLLSFKPFEIDSTLLVGSTLITAISLTVYFTLIMPRARFSTFLISLANQCIYSFAVLSYFLKIESVWTPSGAVQKKTGEYKLFERALNIYIITFVVLIIIRYQNIISNISTLFWISFQVVLFTYLGFYLNQTLFHHPKISIYLVSAKLAKNLIMY
jgi:cellulose synthase (UDP-forming)